MQRLPELPRPPAAQRRSPERNEIASRVMLEEVWMAATFWVKEVGPRESKPTFGTPLFDQTAKVIVAKRAMDVLVDCGPVGRALRDRRASSHVILYAEA